MTSGVCSIDVQVHSSSLCTLPDELEGEFKADIHVSYTRHHDKLPHALLDVNSNNLLRTLFSLERSKARHKAASFVAVSRVLWVHDTLAAAFPAKRSM